MKKLVSTEILYDIGWKHELHPEETPEMMDFQFIFNLTKEAYKKPYFMMGFEDAAGDENDLGRKSYEAFSNEFLSDLERLVDYLEFQVNKLERLIQYSGGMSESRLQELSKSQFDIKDIIALTKDEIGLARDGDGELKEIWMAYKWGFMWGQLEKSNR